MEFNEEYLMETFVRIFGITTDEVSDADDTKISPN